MEFDQRPAAFWPTLAPDGTISGVPVLATTAPNQFAVQVQDSEAVPATVSQTLSISITAGSTSGNSLINGGYSSSSTVSIRMDRWPSSSATDGNGNITSGEEDSNHAGTNNIITAIPLSRIVFPGLGWPHGTMRLVAINPTTS